MATASLGKLEVVFAGDTVALDRAGAQAQRTMKAVEQTASRVESSVAMSLKFAGAVIALKALASIVESTTKSMTDMARSAQSLGFATESFSRLSYASQAAGVSAEALTGSVKELSRRLTNVDPMSETTRALQALGLAYDQGTTKGMKIEDTLLAVADKFASMKDGINKTALAVAVFGDQGLAMIPMLNKGSAGIRAMMTEAGSLGAVLTSEGAKLSTDYSEKMSALGAIVGAVGNQMAQALLPSVNSSMDAMIKWAKANEAAKKAGEYTKVAIDLMSKAFEAGLLPIRLAASAIGQLYEALSHALKGEFAKAAETLGKTFEVMAPIIQSSADKIWGATDSVKEKWKELDVTMGEVAKNQEKRDAPAMASAYEMNLALEQRRALYASMARDITADNTTTTTDKIARLNEMVRAGQITWAEYLATVRGLNEGETQVALSNLTDNKTLPLTTRVEELNRMLAEGQIGLQTYAQNYKQLGEQGEAAMNDLMSTTSTALTSIFKESKAAAIASAIINTYQGISKAIASYPPPISYAMAGLQAAMGFAQVSAIRNTSKSGGGGGGSVPSAGTTSAPAAANAPGAASESTLFVQGVDAKGLFSGDVVRSLAQKLLDFQKDGGRVVLGAT